MNGGKIGRSRRGRQFLPTFSNTMVQKKNHVFCINRNIQFYWTNKAFQKTLMLKSKPENRLVHLENSKTASHTEWNSKTGGKKKHSGFKQVKIKSNWSLESQKINNICAWGHCKPYWFHFEGKKKITIWSRELINQMDHLWNHSNSSVQSALKRAKTEAGRTWKLLH